MIDPSLAIWGWEIPVYLFLGGVVAGMLILGAMLHRRTDSHSRALQVAPFVALGLLSLGMLSLFLDLEHKAYVWRFYLAFKPASPMSWGSWILILVYPAGLLLGLALLDTETRERLANRLAAVAPLSAAARFAFRFADAHRDAIRTSAVLCGIALGLYTGILLGALHAQPLWNSPMLGPLFLSSGVSTGAAVLLLMPLSGPERHALMRWDTLAIVIESALLAIFLLGLATSGEPGRNAFRLLVDGPQASAFWTLVILVGLVGPLALVSIEQRLRLPPLRVVPLLVLAGGFALRWILVAAGQASSWTNLH